MSEPTDEELNIAICEWRGWKKVNYDASNMWWRAKEDGTNEVVHGSLPSHIHGSEALGHLHEAEKGLTDDQYFGTSTRAGYTAYLRDEVAKEKGLTPRFRHVSATPRQRAIALLRVVKPEMFE